MSTKLLKVTELSVNYVGGKISPSLIELEFLNYLDLSKNFFNCTSIPSFLGSMVNLTRLDLHDAQFCGHIPHQLGSLSSLLYLNLKENNGLYVDNLHWMFHLSSMQHLDLSHTKLHREVDWLQIVSSLSSLLELILNNCQLDSLTPSVGFVISTSLRVLDLSENLFNQEIPNWFSNRSTSLLEYLDLRDNSLSGKIPDSLGQLKHLTDLDLSNNSLSGPIPSFLGNLSQMQALLLGVNKLNGTVPKSLGLLSNLFAVSISHNFFTGSLDEAHFSKLGKLKELEISYTPLFFKVNSNWVPPFQLEYVSMISCKIGPNK